MALRFIAKASFVFCMLVFSIPAGWAGGDETDLELFTEMIRHPDRFLQQDAARAVGNQARYFGDVPFYKDRYRKVVPLLVEALKSRDAGVRASAADALGEIRDSRSVKGLINVLQDQEGCAGARAAVLDYYNCVGASAAHALGKIGDRRAVGFLIAALKSSENSIRAAAAGALGELKDANAIEPLRLVLEDTDELLKENAKKALGMIIHDREAKIEAAPSKDQGNETASGLRKGTKEDSAAKAAFYNKNRHIIRKNFKKFSGKLTEQYRLQAIHRFGVLKDKQSLDELDELLPTNRYFDKPVTGKVLDALVKVFKQQDKKMQRHMMKALYPGHCADAIYAYFIESRFKVEPSDDDNGQDLPVHEDVVMIGMRSCF